MEINNKMTSEQIFKNLKLKEHNIYRVIVKTTKDNIEHYAFLFVGFKSGSYCEVYTNNYDAPIPMQKMHSIVIDEELSKIKTLKNDKIMKTYYVVKTRSKEVLENAVNSYLQDGAKLIGGLCVFNSGERDTTFYSQAMMIKKTKK
jgi:predicted secreted protein